MYQKHQKSQVIVTYDAKGNATDYQEIQEVVKIQKRHFKKGEFFMQTFSLEDLVLENKYTITDLKVLFKLKRRLDFNNRIKGFRQSDIAKELGSSQPNVSKSINKLITDGIIYKDGVDYYFSDSYIKYAGDTGKSKRS